MAARDKSTETSDAVEILLRRFVDGKPEMERLVVEERLNDQIERGLFNYKTQTGITQKKSPYMPTVLRLGRYRFFFYSNESQEPPHIHVKAGRDEAKFWLDPISLAGNAGYNGRELNEIEDLVEKHQDQLLEAWNEHFS